MNRAMRTRLRQRGSTFRSRAALLAGSVLLVMVMTPTASGRAAAGEALTPSVDPRCPAPAPSPTRAAAPHRTPMQTPLSVICSYAAPAERSGEYASSPQSSSGAGTNACPATCSGKTSSGTEDPKKNGLPGPSTPALVPPALASDGMSIRDVIRATTAIVGVLLLLASLVWARTLVLGPRSDWSATSDWGGFGGGRTGWSMSPQLVGIAALVALALTGIVLLSMALDEAPAARPQSLALDQHHYRHTLGATSWQFG